MRVARRRDHHHRHYELKNTSFSHRRSSSLTLMGDTTTPSTKRSSPPRPPRRSPHWLRDLPLGAAVTLSLAVFLMAAFLALYLLGRPWTNGWLHLGTEPLSWKDRLLYAGGVVTLSGAVVALVVNYRKQADAETGRFASAFAAAAQQLGDPAPSIRIAGIYALTALADRYSDRRQECIDVLCGYLRLPYNPTAGAGHLTQHNIETANTETHTIITDTHTYRADDREVRLTIIRTIRAHLRSFAAASWWGHHFDFTGATFDGGDFGGASFTGGTVSFQGATFKEGTVSFEGATFGGDPLSFEGATFGGGTVSFQYATFGGGTVSFEGATFGGGTITFDPRYGRLDNLFFDNASFTGGTLKLNGETITSATELGWASVMLGP